jgi:hypothetical protein
MSFSTTTCDILYVGNGTDTTFAIPFDFITGTTDIMVRVDDYTDPANPVEGTPMTYGVGYTVSGTDVIVSVAPTTDERLYIYRQTVDYHNTDYNTYSFPYATVETDFDRIYMRAQELERDIVNLSTNTTAALTGLEPTITAGTTSQYWRGDKSWQTLDKAAVGLGNVDNTTDLGKPISTATQTALDLKANLASPTLTGTPVAPTAAPGTNTTQIATTAFVEAAVAAVPGASDATTLAKGIVQLAGDLGGTAASPTVPGLALKANLASPTFTGTPAAPTAAPNTNSTQIATTAYVDAAVSAAGGGTISSINGENGPTITLAVGTTGTDFAVANTADTVTFNLPTASATNRGALSSADWTTFNNKAPTASPTFTGTPVAPTAAPGTNTTQLATTAFVTAAVAAGGGGGGTVKVATIKEVQAQGTSGRNSANVAATSSNSWQTKMLNTLSDPDSIGVTLASSVFTLPAGTYYIYATVPAFFTSFHRSALYNNTAAAVAILGSNAKTDAYTIVLDSVISGVVTIGVASDFIIQLYTVNGHATGNGLALNVAGFSEVYTQVTVMQLA